MEPLYKIDHLTSKQLENGIRYIYERNTQLIVLEKCDGSVVIGTLENQHENPFEEENIKKLVEVSLLKYNLPEIAFSKDAVLSYNIYVNNFFDINENASKTILQIIKKSGNSDAKWDYLHNHGKILEHKDRKEIISLESTICMDSSFFRDGRYEARKYPFFNVTTSYHNEQVEMILSIILNWFDEIGLEYYYYNSFMDRMESSPFGTGYLFQDICRFFKDGIFSGDRDRSIPQNYIVSKDLYEQALYENEQFDVYEKKLNEFLQKITNNEIPEDKIAQEMLEVSENSIKYKEITGEYYPFEKKLTKIYEKRS